MANRWLPVTRGWRNCCSTHSWPAQNQTSLDRSQATITLTPRRIALTSILKWCTVSQVEDLKEVSSGECRSPLLQGDKGDDMDSEARGVSSANQRLLRH